MDENVAKAVERMCTPLDESVLKGETAKEDARCMALIRARLVELEAENERLEAEVQIARKLAASRGWRVEQGEALLREALPFCDTFPDLLRDGGDELRTRITAHLSENGHVQP